MGILFSFIAQSWPPKTEFTAEDVPSLSGKVVLITGGNTGIGFQTAQAVLRRDAVVYVACRSEEKGKQAIEALKESTGKTAKLLLLDLANLQSVKTAAAEFLAQESQLHILFNNAGVMVPPPELMTPDGYDLTFGTNVVGHFYLTKLLLPALLAVSQNTSEKARVVNTSSFASELTKKIDYSALKNRKVSTDQMYTQSKFGNVLFANELARRYGDQGIISTSLNPGNLESDLQRNVTRLQSFILKTFILQPIEFGPLTQLYAGTSPEGVDLNGKYLVPWGRVYRAPPATRDPAKAKELWDWLESEIEAFEAKHK